MPRIYNCRISKQKLTKILRCNILRVFNLLECGSQLKEMPLIVSEFAGNPCHTRSWWNRQLDMSTGLFHSELTDVKSRYIKKKLYLDNL